MSTEIYNDEQEEQQKLESKENFKEKTNKLKKKKSVHTTEWITLENTVRQKKQKLIHNSVYPKTY